MFPNRHLKKRKPRQMPQSKFGVRPAPRKRPWLCKASPKALPVPANPPSLMASISLWFPTTPPPFPEITLTALMKPTFPAGPYIGTWADGADFVQVDFLWVNPATFGSVNISWSVGPWTDTGAWPLNQVIPWPNLRYISANLQFTAGGNFGSILITN